nr:MAG TPA: hypothetical protein [Caudoviricetes sp.]
MNNKCQDVILIYSLFSCPLKGSFILDCFDRNCHIRYNRKDKQIPNILILARLRWLGGFELSQEQ